MLVSVKIHVYCSFSLPFSHTHLLKHSGMYNQSFIDPLDTEEGMDFILASEYKSNIGAFPQSVFPK